MTLLVDTSVWSLALRRDRVTDLPEVEALTRALRGDELVATTGLILQELLQGAVPEGSRSQIRERFGAFTYITPAREDHESAAEVRNQCRRAGVQIGTVDALIVQICLSRDLMLLSTDRDFEHAARVVPLRLWRSS